nr:sensor histidine kinase [Cytobacillus purgationiresistens]
MPAYYIADETDWKMVAGFGMLFLFLLSYRQLYFTLATNERFTGWLVLQIVIILVLSIFYHFNNLLMGFFTANFIGWYREKRTFYIALTLFGIALVTPIIIHFNQLINGAYYLLIMIVVMMISPFGIRSMNSKMELEQKLDEANEQIEALVKREERMRIARDLHDTLGHTLSLITLKSQLVVKMMDKDIGGAKREAKEIERTSRIALQQVRELVSDMRTITISEVLLESEDILETANISSEINIAANLDDIPSITQNILAMCVREGVTNVVKHSNAKKCSITCKEYEGKIKIIIKDDGNGMKCDKEKGNGIKGMSERLELIDGDFSLSSISGSGMVLRVTVPVIKQERKEGAS